MEELETPGSGISEKDYRKSMGGVEGSFFHSQVHSNSQSKVEKYNQPMRTGVSAARSEVRNQQAKWILEGVDEKKYSQEGLSAPWEKYPEAGTKREKERMENEKKSANRDTPSEIYIDAYSQVPGVGTSMFHSTRNSERKRLNE